MNPQQFGDRARIAAAKTTFGRDGEISHMLLRRGEPPPRPGDAI